MDNTEIKKYKNLVWVEVSLWFDKEILYWEWTKLEFKQKRTTCDYMYFPIHDREVYTNKMKDFWEVVDNKTKSLEMKLSWLSQTQKQKVKDRMKEIKSNLWREASDNETDRIIRITIDPEILEQEKLKEKEYWKPLSYEQRLWTNLVIQKHRIAKIITWKIWWFNSIRD